MTKNEVRLIGRLGQEPETYEGTDFKVVTLKIATQESYFDKDKNEWVDLPTDWHTIKIRKPQQVKRAVNLRKGDEVIIDGKIRYKEHEGKYYTFIQCEWFKGFPKAENTNQPPSVSGSQPQSVGNIEPDLPL